LSCPRAPRGRAENAASAAAPRKKVRRDGRPVDCPVEIVLSLPAPFIAVSSPPATVRTPPRAPSVPWC
ncbi:MAG TPA: hypothetical protein PLI98_15165, partial [Candidatus Hydrogenedentes bacterium]|nr:hypothetical protein [Candidatus Hydrogenedentota bacterium]